MSPPHWWCVRGHDCTAAAARPVAWHDPGVSALGIHHVGIAVRDLEEAARATSGSSGPPSRRTSASTSRASRRSRCCSATSGRVELLAPLADDTPVGRFLARRGEGMHHLAFGVADIEAELARLRAAGATLIDERPRAGIYGAVAFVHHESLGGVLSELIQSTQVTEA